VSQRHFIDLHLHSRYSRATSPALTPANLSRWAEIKGLALLGTGDLTHPAWRRELAESLTERDDGFYSLRDRPDGPRFIPTGEVSAIYKQDGRTRKIHLVVISPDLAAADEFARLLGAFGRLEADGRPILGLTARQILDIALTSHPATQVVPAHIWTPWFSLFGARSGFDRLEECFGDLSPHITALETGLSSDPDMNRLVSALDSRALICTGPAPRRLGSCWDIGIVLWGKGEKMHKYILIGIPYCGKSTPGRLTADKMKLPFFDTDAMTRGRLKPKSAAAWFYAHELPLKFMYL